jgi:hypothetical protein
MDTKYGTLTVVVCRMSLRSAGASIIGIQQGRAYESRYRISIFSSMSRN